MVRLIVVNTVEVGKNPYDIAINPNTNMIYITNQGHDTVTIIKG
jgi:DNA-binding beta-propeller fold protein YncE